MTTHNLRVPAPSGCGSTLIWMSDAQGLSVSYRVTVTCPRCASAVKHIASGSRWSWQQAAAIACTACRWRGVLNVDLAETAKRAGREVMAVSA